MTASRTISVRISGTKYFCIAASTADGIAHFALSGRLVRGPEGAVGSLHDTISRAVRHDTRKIVVDLSGVERIDAAGIGELVFTYTTARSGGMTLLLENPQSFIKKLLAMCHVDTFLVAALDEVEHVYAAAAAKETR